MEIHKPKPFHNLREFLKEYAIIVLGVATALAAEQTVEYLRHRSELYAVRIDLDEEKKQNIEIFRHAAASFRQSETYLKGYLATLRRAIKDPAVPLPPMRVPLDFVFSQSAVWTAAQRSGALTLMPPGEQRANDRLYLGLRTQDDSEGTAFSAAIRTAAIFSSGVAPAELTADEKQQLYRDATALLAMIEDVRVVQRVTIRFNPEFAGAEVAPAGGR